MGMTDNTKALIKALCANDYRRARMCAIACMSEDETQKNASFVNKYKPILLNEASVIELPSNLKYKLEALDMQQVFRDDRYYKTKETLDIANEIAKISKASDILASKQIPYLNATLLYGVPGTGKSMLAKYIAYTMKLPYVYVNFAQLINSNMGGTSNSLNLAFEFAKRTPCIFVIDEIDAIAVKRSENSNQGTDGEMNRITITLMQEFDRLLNSTILVACTNRVDRIDEALLDRFNLKKELKLPSEQEKAEMIEQYLSTIEISSDNYDDIFSKAMKGKSQREIINLIIKEYADIIIRIEEN